MANTQLVNDRYVQMFESNMGPQLMAYMQDEKITEIMLNPDGHVWIDTQDQGLVESPITM